MPGKFDHHNKDVLVSPERYESIDPQRILSMLPILAYHEVADVGCGPGFFTIPLAKYLFDGRVYALDVQQEMLDATQKEVEKVNLTNVELMLNKENELLLKDESLDGVFMAFVLHEAESVSGLLGEARRCLRKGGWLAALDWHKRETESGPPVEERIDEADMGAMAQEAGFRIEVRHNLNTGHYMIVMRK